jgi:hypothetical protein
MARDGSGTYSNPYPDFVAGTVISSTEVDANNSDIATALTQSIAVDGQTTVTANLPMATYKFTGLGAGSAATDSANLGQVQAGSYIWCGTMAGGADAGTLSPTPAITAYAAGQRFVWMASSNVNTGAMTVAISGLSTIAVQNDGAALAAGDHAANKMYMGVLNTTSTIQIIRVSGLVDSSVTTAKIAADAITSAKIADDAITSAKIADDAVTLAKMASATDGVIITYDASGNPTHVGPGSDGEVLTSTGAGSPPAFEAAAGGGKVLQVVTAATSTQVDTTSSTMADTTLTASITPANSANKILILISQAVSSSSRAGGEIDILRGATVIETYSQVNDADNQRANHFLQYLDSPSSTSSTTYKTQGARIDQSGTLQFQRNDASGNATSAITLIELDYS